MNSEKRSTHPAAAVLLSGLALLSGCGTSDGPVRAAVSGTVRYDGEPLRNGTLRFVPSGSDTPEKMAEIVDGRFELSAEVGPFAGVHRVEIEAKGPGAFDDEQLMAKLEASGAAKGPRHRKQFDVPIIPAKYNRRTELTATIVAGEQNTFDFDLAK